MTIDIRIRGWRFYLDLSPEQSEEPAEPAAQPAVQLSTPMRISPGFVTWEQIRAASETGKLK